MKPPTAPIRVASRLAAAVCLLSSVALAAEAQSPLVETTEAGVSVHARGVPLGRVLAELDAVAGTESTVPPELDGYGVNAWFDDVSVDQAVKRIFEGLPLDYVVIGQRRVVVTAVSEPVETQRGAPGVVRSARPQVLPQAPQAGLSNPFQIPGQAVPSDGAGAVTRGRTAAPFTSPFGVPFNPQVNTQGGPGFPGGQGQQNVPFGTPRGSQSLPSAFPDTDNVFGNTSPALLDLNQVPSERTSPSPSPPQVPIPPRSQP